MKRLTNQLTFANGKSSRSKRYKLLADHFGQIYVADLATYKPDPSKKRAARTSYSDKVRVVSEPDEANKALQQEIHRVVSKKEALLLNPQVFCCVGKSHNNVVHAVRTAHHSKHCYVLKLDIRNAFGSVNHDSLKRSIHSSGLFTSQAGRFVRDLVLNDVKPFKRGLPQGHPLSTTFFNLFMQPLDTFLVKQGYQWYRYVDDIGVFFPTVKEARAAKQLIEAKVEKMGLELHPLKTRVVSIYKTTLLGYRFKANQDGTLASYPSVKRFKDTVDSIFSENYRKGEDAKTLRIKLNKYIKSWALAYPETTHIKRLETLDKWVKRKVLEFIHARYLNKDERLVAFKVLLGKDKIARKLANKIHKNPIEILNHYTGTYSFRIRSIKDTFNSQYSYPPLRKA